MLFWSFSFPFNNSRSYDGESWIVWEQFGEEETNSDTAEEPVCTEIRYRVTLTIDGETHSFETKPVRFELDDTMDLETIAHITMDRIDEGKMMELTWSHIPCIGNYNITICAIDGDMLNCEMTQIEGKEERFVREVDPCGEYSLTITDAK